MNYDDEHFKTNLSMQPAFKYAWIQNKTKDGGAMTYAIDQQKFNECVLFSYTHSYGSKLYATSSTDSLVKLIQNQRGLHETISKYLPHFISILISRQIQNK